MANFQLTIINIVMYLTRNSNNNNNNYIIQTIQFVTLGTIESVGCCKYRYCFPKGTPILKSSYEQGFITCS